MVEPDELEKSEDSIFNLTISSLDKIDNTDNIQPTYIKLTVENIPFNFEADTGFAHSAIFEKIYFRYFSNKKRFRIKRLHWCLF